MRKYVIGTTLLGLFLMTLSVVNLFEIIHSKHRAREASKNIDQQYDLISVLNKGGGNLSSSNQIDLLKRFNREIESNIVFLNASNNRLHVHTVLLLLGILVLCALVLKVRSMRYRQTIT